LLVLSGRRVTRRVSSGILLETTTLAIGLLPRWQLTAVVLTGPRCDLRGRHTSGAQNSTNSHPCREKCGNGFPFHVASLSSLLLRRGKRSGGHSRYACRDNAAEHLQSIRADRGYPATVGPLTAEDNAPVVLYCAAVLDSRSE
jgi:hypothetical protein